MKLVLAETFNHVQPRCATALYRNGFFFFFREISCKKGQNVIRQMSVLVHPLLFVVFWPRPVVEIFTGFILAPIVVFLLHVEMNQKPKHTAIETAMKRRGSGTIFYWSVRLCAVLLCAIAYDHGIVFIRIVSRVFSRAVICCSHLCAPFVHSFTLSSSHLFTCRFCASSALSVERPLIHQFSHQLPFSL